MIASSPQPTQRASASLRMPKGLVQASASVGVAPEPTASPPRKTVLSEGLTYRYVLWREWAPLLDDGSYAVIIGLNPSTADATRNDNTINREIAFAKAWGVSALCKLNLFAFRSTDPKGLRTTADPIGPENDRYLLEYTRNARLVVAAWGTHGTLGGRDVQVRRLLKDVALHYLQLTKDGHPSHPLYLPGDLKPQLWTPPPLSPRP